MRHHRSGSSPTVAPLKIFGANDIFARNIAALPAATNQVPAENMKKQMEQAVLQNSASFSPSLYVIPAGHPTQKVAVEGEHAELQERCEAVPVPILALVPSGSIWTPTGTDKWVCFWQPSTDSLWEFWEFKGTPGAYMAGYGGFITNVSTRTGIFPNTWGARATSLALCGGMLSIQDIIEVLRGGSINHAFGVNLAVTKPVNESEKGPIAPATRFDASVNNESLKEYGVAESNWFRLAPHAIGTYIDSETEPLATAMDQAMQTYGFFVCDTSGGNVTINVQSMQHAASIYAHEKINPYAGLKSPTAPYFDWNASQFNSYSKSLKDLLLPLLKEVPSEVLKKIPFSLIERIEPRVS